MKTFKAIQPPTENSQFLSHIHCFQLPDGVVPQCMQETYFDCELIYKNKLLLLAEDAEGLDEEIDEEVDEGAVLSRQRSAPPPVEDGDEVLSRQKSPAPPVMC